MAGTENGQEPPSQGLEAEQPDSRETSRGYPVVGIGASAGGLEALQDFFQRMPSDSGMSFVVVQHLARGRAAKTSDDGPGQTVVGSVEYS